MRHRVLSPLSVLAAAVLAWLNYLAVPAAAQVVPVSNANNPSYIDPSTGDLNSIDQIVSDGRGTSAQLIGYTSEDWNPYTINSPIDFNGNTLFDDQGGNPHTWNGAFSGTGLFIASGPSITLGGMDANTFTGQYQVNGTLYLQKPSGVDAVAGPLTIGDNMIVQLLNNQQIDAGSVVTLSPTSATAILRLNGNSNTIGGLASSSSGAAFVDNENPGTAGALTVSPSAGSYNFSGTIRDGDIAGNGTLSFALSGAGQQVLSGVNAYSGGTTVNSGMLTVNGTLGHANITVNGGTLNGSGTVTFNPGEEILVNGGGTFDASGGMQWNLANLSAFGSPFNLLDFSAGGATFVPPSSSLNKLLAPGSANRFTLEDVNNVVEAVALTNYFWNVDASSNWNNAANWTTGIPNSQGGVANFGPAITQSRTVIVDVPVTLGSMAFGSTSRYTLLDTTGTNAITFDNLGSDSTIEVDLGSHVIAAPLILSGNGALDVKVVPSSSTLTISGNIGEAVPGTGVLNIAAGAGTLLLTGSNTFTGGVVVSSGTLLAGGGCALASTVGVTVAAGGSFGLNAASDNQTIGSLNVQSATGAVMPNGGTLNVAANGNNNIYGLTGPGTFIVTTTGGATTMLASNAAFTGNMTINNGTIYADTTTGAFGSGAGIATLNNVYWGAVNSTNQTFHVTSGTTEFSSWGGTPVFTGGMAIDSGATFQADTGGGNGFDYNGPISGQGTLLVTAAGGDQLAQSTPLVLGGTAANTLSGPTIVLDGILALAKPDGVNAVAGPLTIGNGSDYAHVVLEANEQINPAVTVTISQSGDLRLNGFNETIGGLSSAAGEGAVGNFGTSASTLTIAGSGSSSFGGALVDGGTAPLALVMNGNGTLVLGGTDSYSGGTTVEAGTLAIAAASALPAGTSLAIGAGGTFVFDPTVSGSPVTGGALSAGVTAVPEPNTLALLATGLTAAFGVWKWKKRIRRDFV